MKTTDIKMSNFFVRLYRYFYDMDCYDKMPPSLCAFTPKLIAACLLIIPFEILGLPITIARLFCPKDWKYHCPGLKACFTVILAFLAVVVWFMFLPVLNFWHIQRHQDVIAALCVDAFVGLVIVCFILHGIFGKNSMIGAYLRAKKEKICPKINWIEDEV